LWTFDLDRPAERLDAILEVDEAGSPARIRAAASVVADRKAEPRVVEIEIEIDLDPRCVGMLRDIRECFRGDVVGGDLDSIGRPLLMTHVELHGTAERRASASSAGDKPPLLRTAGWIPRDISRSSSTTLVT